MPTTLPTNLLSELLILGTLNNEDVNAYNAAYESTKQNADIRYLKQRGCECLQRCQRIY